MEERPAITVNFIQTQRADCQKEPSIGQVIDVELGIEHKEKGKKEKKKESANPGDCYLWSIFSNIYILTFKI